MGDRRSASYKEWLPAAAASASAAASESEATSTLCGLMKTRIGTETSGHVVPDLRAVAEERSKRSMSATA